MSLFLPPRPVTAVPLAPVPQWSMPAYKAGPVGPGAGVLQTEYPLSLLTGQNDPARKMRRAWQMGISVPWIRAAERVISGACSTVPWHLEDGDGNTIDDETPDPIARSIQALMEKPQAAVPVGRKLTRRQLWSITFRHTGLCGTAFWYLDQPNPYGIPAAFLYIRPDRMTPKQDAAGNLLWWKLDCSSNNPEGTKIELTEVLQFDLEPADQGHFGIGLVESAMLKAQNSTAEDSHVSQVLAAGGRLSGLISPKQGDHLEQPQYDQLVLDARTVTEGPDAAKRLQILKGPIDFVSTAMTLQELDVVKLMTLSRDDLLALWGVPLSQIGGATPAGLNSGDTRKYDRQALWENANHPRIVGFTETIQYGLLDRLEKNGIETVQLVIDEPKFSDDNARYDLVQKSLSVPLRNWERRELVGKDPLGIPEFDDAVWLPITVQQVFTAPDTEQAGYVEAVVGGATAIPDATTPQALPATTAPAPPALPAATPSAPRTAPLVPAKATLPTGGHAAIHRVLVATRARIDTATTPRVKKAVATVLADQRSEIAQRARAAAAHLMRRPTDTSVWWDGAKWDRRMKEALQPHLVMAAELVDGTIRDVLNMPAAQKAGPVGAVAHTLAKGGTRITGLNGRTRDAVLATVRRTVAAGIADGKSPADVGDDLEEAIGVGSLDNGVSLWDEYRAEMVARTEMTAAYNAATLGSYTDLGVDLVQAIDGDEDEECAERDGQTFSTDEADTMEDHPNGTLDWVPVLPDEGDAE